MKGGYPWMNGFSPRMNRICIVDERVFTLDEVLSGLDEDQFLKKTGVLHTRNTHIILFSNKGGSLC
jgi:hypothetical protein